ncbi:MAG TPA: NAD(P)H-binding protein [Burkholderiales bacterium]|nr:NAD(P)H-binding protein [Burkholderiales bacterium]
MKLLVLGATGPTGLQVVRQALDLGHEVTAFVRDPKKLTVADRRLDVVTGVLPGSAQTLAGALRGRSAVISALGVRNAFRAHGLIEQSMRVLVPAMQHENVRRLVIVSAMGVGGSRRDAPLVPRLVYRLLLGDIFADKLAGEAVVRASSLDWTFLYPTLLTDGPRSGRYRAAERLALRGMPRISRADVADFALRILSDAAWSGKIAMLSD